MGSLDPLGMTGKNKKGGGADPFELVKNNSMLDSSFLQPSISTGSTMRNRRME